MKKRPPVKKRPGRYAVLRHENTAHPHFDFLLEVRKGGLLKTWRLVHWPMEQGQRATSTRLPDHRNLYLEYEGPLTDGRGVVFHIEGGECEFGEVDGSPSGFEVWIDDYCLTLGAKSAKCKSMADLDE